MEPLFFFSQISHNRAKKGTAMLILLALAASGAALRLAWSALQTLRALPRSNADWIFY
jgi:hypothetical protein